MLTPVRHLCLVVTIPASVLVACSSPTPSTAPPADGPAQVNVAAASRPVRTPTAICQDAHGHLPGRPRQLQPHPIGDVQPARWRPSSRAEKGVDGVR
jgi:hypothetical protein